MKMAKRIVEFTLDFYKRGGISASKRMLSRFEGNRMWLDNTGNFEDETYIPLSIITSIKIHNVKSTFK